MRPRVLNATIQELLVIFKDALIALVPSMERARIPWREPDAYDDWDSIASQLFRSIVENSCREALADAFPISPYGIVKKRYLDSSFISVSSADNHFTDCALICFTTENQPFDTVRFQTLDPLKRVGMLMAEIPWESARFSLSVNEDGRISKVANVSISL